MGVAHAKFVELQGLDARRPHPPSLACAYGNIQGILKSFQGYVGVLQYVTELARRRLWFFAAPATVVSHLVKQERSGAPRRKQGMSSFDSLARPAFPLVLMSLPRLTGKTLT
ncbi:hypothetical protein VNO77_19891 [Canavalia gladiata]|uniref:Uncharacterized protein n=1 Tax=Canavalia gladiata TaxID=3824 RepID=A0AAN9LNB8_CANGL